MRKVLLVSERRGRFSLFSFIVARQEPGARDAEMKEKENLFRGPY